MFKQSFKYYKSRSPKPDLKDVIDFDNPDLTKVRIIKSQISEQRTEFGLIQPKKWNIYELISIPGLIFIRNPFTVLGQRYWITKCLKEYTSKPNKLNLDPHNLLEENETWWDVSFGNTKRAKELLSKLRWATIGYHHDWDTKHYSENNKTVIPMELQSLVNYLAKVLNFPKFKAEAGIINYYRMNSTLAGHTDHSEMNIDAPLFSISFGQTAIFLIGGTKIEEPAIPVYLHSGDIIVMSGSSRLCYHGVPKILPAFKQPWKSTNDLEDNKEININDWNKAENYISEARINMNVRQVLNPGQITIN